MRKVLLFVIIGIVVYYLYIKYYVQTQTISTGTVSQGSVPSVVPLNMPPLTNSISTSIANATPFVSPTSGATPISPVTIYPAATTPVATIGGSLTKYTSLKPVPLPTGVFRLDRFNIGTM